MFLKKNSLLFYFLMGLAPIPAKTQVYRFQPAFSTLISYDGKKGTYTWVNGMPTARANSHFIFDVDNKRIVRPHTGPADTLSVVAIERDQENRRLIFRLQPQDFKDFKERWSAWIIQFDSDGTTPLYFQQGHSLTEYHSKDSMLVTYTSHRGNFPFSILSTGIKEDTTMSTGSHEEKSKALFSSSYREADNRLIMRPGFGQWTKGKGRKATVLSFQVDSVRQIERTNLIGIAAFCKSPDEPGNIEYVIQYLYPKNTSRVHEVHILRFRLGRLLSLTILRTY